MIGLAICGVVCGAEGWTEKMTSFRSIQVILLMVLKCDEIIAFEQVSKDTATFGAERDTLLQPLFDQKLIQLDEAALCQPSG
jgi:hypothetical protein